ncbi:MAG: hypothetical protein AB7T49_16080 [Oligoflexales bacterium]
MLKRVFALLILTFHTSLSAGVINGNGESVDDLEETTLPNSDQLYAYLNKLKKAEPTWVARLKGAFDITEGAVIAKSHDRCYEETVSEGTEIRAFFKEATKIIVLCPKFYESDVNTQLVATIHEATHFALYKMNLDLASDAEEVIKLIDGKHRNAITAENFPDYKTAVLGMRSLLDRFIPDLGAYAEASHAGPLSPVKITKNPNLERLTFPIPGGLDDPEYIPPHFIEYMLAQAWSNGDTYEPGVVEELMSPDTPAHDHPIWDTEFLFAKDEGARKWRAHWMSPDNTYYSGFNARVLFDYEITDELLAAFQKLGINSMRYITKEWDGEGLVFVIDHVE